MLLITREATPGSVSPGRGAAASADRLTAAGVSGIQCRGVGRRVHDRPPPAGVGGGGTPYLWMHKWSAARYTGEFSMACGIMIAPLRSGSGKFVEPWARMHTGEPQRLRHNLPLLAGKVGRQQGPAGMRRRPGFETADPELTRSELGLVELSAAVWVGPERHAVGAHAASVDERLVVGRRRGGVAAGGARRTDVRDPWVRAATAAASDEGADCDQHSEYAARAQPPTRAAAWDVTGGSRREAPWLRPSWARRQKLAAPL